MSALSRRHLMQFMAGAALAPLAGLLPGRSALAADAKASVALLLPGSVADGGWNTLAFKGLQDLKAEGYKVAYSEKVPQAQMEQIIRGYGDDGYDLIIGHSFEYGSAFTEIGADYPKSKFFASTFKPGENAPKNVEFVNMAYLQAAYSAGALAALISEKGKAVGVVGGGDNPTQQAMMHAFIAGAEATRSGLKGLGIVTGDYNNAAKGREAATTMIGNGADVIWHTADVTGLGALQGAAAAKVKAIGSFADQTDVAPDFIATNLKQNLDWLVREVGHSVAGDKFLGGEEWQLKLTEGWTPVCGSQPYNPKLIDAGSWSKFQAIWADVDSGKIDVKTVIKS
ncbi:BMP family ABC transporter substrate-binding protein [Labrys miyagiensis]